MKKLASLLLISIVVGCGGGTDTETGPAVSGINSSATAQQEVLEGSSDDLASSSSSSATPKLQAAATHATATSGSYNYFPGKPVPFAQTSGKVVGAYLPHYSMSGGYNVSTVTANNLTHLIYAFINICGPDQSAETASTCVDKKDFELAVTNTSKSHYAQLQDVKSRAPQLKLMASIGGPSGGKPYYHLAGDPARRAVFVNSVVSFLSAHPAYDGIDVDWENPTRWCIG